MKHVLIASLAALAALGAAQSASAGCSLTVKITNANKPVAGKPKANRIKAVYLAYKTKSGLSFWGIKDFGKNIRAGETKNVKYKFWDIRGDQKIKILLGYFIWNDGVRYERQPRSSYQKCRTTYHFTIEPESFD